MNGSKTLAVITMGGILACGLLFSPTAAVDVSQKADFILKLIDYVEWPAGKQVDASGAIVIACVGESPEVAKLKELAAAKSAEGLKVTVKVLSATDTLAGNQIVYISNCDKAELAKVLKGLGTKPTLTVSSCASFARFGVMVNILDDASSGSKVSFEVNTITVKEAGLKIGSQLLKLATVI